MSEILVETPSKPPALSLDFWSKSLAAAAVVMYAIGFAIVAVFNGSHGVPDPNPLRPKLAYVGFVFLLLTVLPVATTLPIIRVLFSKETPKRYFATFLLSYCWASLFIALAGKFLFQFTAAPASNLHGWREWALLVVTIGISSLSYFYQAGDRAQKVKRTIFLYALAFAYIAVLLYQDIPRQDEFTFNQLRLWLLVSGVAGGFMSAIVLHPEHRRKLDWPVTVLYFVYAISIYPVFVFPHIKAAFGGGQLADVTIFISKTSSTFACTQLKAQLIDERDEGFYVQTADKRTMLIPRGSVDGIIYSLAPLPTEIPAKCTVDGAPAARQ
jgi:hypothetical protein